MTRSSVIDGVPDGAAVVVSFRVVCDDNIM
jgi:hypothetical protein